MKTQQRLGIEIVQTAPLDGSKAAAVFTSRMIMMQCLSMHHVLD